jgi:hypothetical protein
MLLQHQERIEDLMSVIENAPRPIPIGDLAAIRDAYAAIKNALHRDMETTDGAKSGRDAAISSAVRQAWCRLAPATNSNPIASNWLDALGSALIDIKYGISIQGE